MRRLAEAADVVRWQEELSERRRRWREEALRRNGFPETVACPECGDVGLTGRDEPCFCEAGRELAKGSLRLAAWEERLPRRVRDFRLSTAPDTRAAAKAAAWCRNRPWATGQNLLVAGPPGTGKTGLGVGCLWLAHEREVTVAYVNVAEWLDLMRPSGSDARRQEQESAARRAARVQVLLLDDLGAERPSEWTVERVYTVVNARYDAGLPTIVTTNAAQADLVRVYGQRIVDRLMEESRSIVMQGANLRRPDGAKRGSPGTDTPVAGRG